MIPRTGFFFLQKNNMRTMIKSLLMSSLLGLRDILNPLMRFEGIAILCYHSISEAELITAMPASAFEFHLRLLRERGYTFVSLADILAHLRGTKKLPRKSVAITFDDGYADFESAALP